MSVNDYRKQVRETSEPDLSTNLGRLIASAPPAPAAPVRAESIECGNCFEGKSDGDHICRACNGTGERATAGNAAPTEADENAPWLTLAHTICADVGIEPGHITDRLTTLRDLLDAALRGNAATAAPGDLLRKAASLIGSQFENSVTPPEVVEVINGLSALASNAGAAPEWQVQKWTTEQWISAFAWDRGHTIPSDTFDNPTDAYAALRVIADRYDESAFRVHPLHMDAAPSNNSPAGAQQETK